MTKLSTRIFRASRGLAFAATLLAFFGSVSSAETISFKRGENPESSYTGAISMRIDRQNPGNSLGNMTWMEVIKNGNDVKRSLLSFDLSQIPTGAIIESVSLTLVSREGQNGNNGSTPITVELFSTAAFTSSNGNWTNNSAFDSADMLSSNSVIASEFTAGQQLVLGSSVDFVAYIQSVLNGSDQTAYLMLKLPEAIESDGSYHRLVFEGANSGNTYGNGEYRRPELTITYSIPEPATVSMWIGGLALAAVVTVRMRRR